MKRNLAEIFLYILTTTMMIAGIITIYAFFRFKDQYEIVRIETRIEIPYYLRGARRIGDSDIIVYQGDTMELRMQVKKSYSFGILSRDALKRKLDEINAIH